MSRRTDKQDRAAGGFIKGRTAGTSNEISFSVLDAKTSGTPYAPASKLGRKANKEPKGADRWHFFKGIPVFTLKGRKTRNVDATPSKDQGVFLQSGEYVTGSKTTNTPAPGTLNVESSDSLKARSSGRHGAAGGNTISGEIARRKTSRVRGQFIGILVACIVAVSMFFFAGSFFTDNSKAHQAQVTRLMMALNDVKSVDRTLVAMDKVLSSPIDMSSFDAMVEIETNAETLTKKLDDAEEVVKSVLSVIDASSDSQAAQNALTAIQARKTMLTSGLDLIAKSKDAAQAVELVLTGWAQIYAVDDAMKEIARTLSAGSDIDVTAAHEAAAKAHSNMTAAQAQLQAAAELFHEADMESQLAYANMRLKATKDVYEATQYLQALDVERASVKIADANAAEQEAAALALKIPAYPSEPIATYYINRTASLTAEYEEAREKAANADAFLRNYLGT